MAKTLYIKTEIDCCSMSISELVPSTGSDANTILECLDNVMTVGDSGDKGFRLTDGCDSYHAVDLTPKQMLDLADTLKAMAMAKLEKNVTAAKVKELREITGLGMFESKKLLIESGGDIDLACQRYRR